MAMAYNISSNWNGSFPTIVNPIPPVVIYPTVSSSSDYYIYDIYPYVIVICLVLLMLSLTKVVVNRKRAKQTAPRNGRARQGQVPTVSGSVDSDSINYPDMATTSQTASAEHTKVDLPPTYDEVMKVFLEGKQTAVASIPETTATAADETRTCSAVQINIDDPPPPQYSSVQSP